MPPAANTHDSCTTEVARGGSEDYLEPGWRCRQQQFLPSKGLPPRPRMPSTRSQSARRTRSAIAESNEPPQTSALHAEQASSDVRLRQEESARYITNDTTWATKRPRDTGPDEPPKFIIDLSLPPEQRYLEVCTIMKDEIVGLTSLFDEVVVMPVARIIPAKWVHSLCRVLLRGIYSREENAELKGISKATGVAMYLLVCFNVLLDLFMGCSSGGAAVGAESEGRATKMLHFRTLDWGMPALRRIVVQLDFVTERDGPVLASSVTYAGFVGVLTAVRKDFSVSLNFRPNHDDADKFWANTLYSWHLLMVLVGFRQSIASILRDCLLPKKHRRGEGDWTTISYDQVVQKFGKVPVREESKPRKLWATTACYLCFSNGVETMVVEKDRISARTRSDTDFIVITNNDDRRDNENDAPEAISSQENSIFAAALAEIVHEAADRKSCAEHNWHNMKVARAKEHQFKKSKDIARSMSAGDVITLVQRYPTTNETTHFACVMDPMQGRVVWCRRWLRPVSAKWIRSHQSDTW